MIVNAISKTRKSGVGTSVSNDVANLLECLNQLVRLASWMAWFQFKNGTTVRKWSLIFVGTQEMSRVSSWQYLGQCWITFTISYENLWTTYSTSASRVIVLKLFWYYTLTRGKSNEQYMQFKRNLHQIYTALDL